MLKIALKVNLGFNIVADAYYKYKNALSFSLFVPRTFLSYVMLRLRQKGPIPYQNCREGSGHSVHNS